MERVPRENIWDCLSLRLWDYLEAPEDLPVRSACRSLEALPSWDGVHPETGLQVPHLALSITSLPWAQKRICVSSVESLRLFAKTGDQVEDNEGLFCKILCWFAKAGGEPWVRWLLTAILRDGRLKVAENPGPPGPPGPPGGKGSKGSAAGSALLAAAGSGQVHVLRCLLKASADVRTTDENECTALHWAADQGHAEACKLLIKSGACVDDADDDAWTPLCLAAEEGHLQTCKVLLAFGARVSIPDEDLRSPLWWAAWRKHSDLVKLLLRHRADVNQSDRWGVSPKMILNDSAPIARRCAPHL
ncbi:unnamed protein product [Cladocopium goreaui]|uniref:Uncharacterized protein n=1 Tax=Cladocopium goreaui TaxID=2562237 RepID=A0A9P1CKT7_9DINO|nr:unnamed protein product [Cladocopium goreaui]